MPRRTTLSAQLARMGFADPAQAERLSGGDLALDVDGGDAGLLAALAGAADPDLALAALARMPRDAELLAALHQDSGLARRLALVLGASVALGDHLARHPEGWRILRGPEPLACPSAGELRSALLTAVGADPVAREPVAAGQQAGLDAGPAAALRVAYRQGLLHLAARDLTGQMAIDDVAAELADLAAAALEAALAVSRSQLPAGAAPCRLAVIAMGKCGGRELNYASDVDVIFVAEPAEGAADHDGNGAALLAATQLAAALIRVCS